MGFKKLRGKAPKRRLWRMKRGAFEEAARLADTKWPGIAMPRRWNRFSPKRRLRRMKRAGFEEVPRLAAWKGTPAGRHDGGPICRGLEGSVQDGL